jgi:hypothetical protein
VVFDCGVAVGREDEGPVGEEDDAGEHDGAGEEGGMF